MLETSALLTVWFIVFAIKVLYGQDKRGGGFCQENPSLCLDDHRFRLDEEFDAVKKDSLMAQLAPTCSTLPSFLPPLA